VTEWTSVALVQPKRSRRWEIRRGDEMLASLQLPALRRGGRAEVEGRELTIETHGLFRVEHVLRDRVTHEQIARIRPDGRRQVLELAGRDFEWRSLGRGKGHGLVGPDGEPVLRAKVRSGVFRTSGEVWADADISDGEARLLALLASYLLISKAEETAAAVSSGATAGGV
jgi:hypothetical protein